MHNLSDQVWLSLAEAECTAPKTKSRGHQPHIFYGQSDSHDYISPRKQMDPPGPGEANHMGLDELQARKIKVFGSEKKEGGKQVSLLEEPKSHQS